MPLTVHLVGLKKEELDGDGGLDAAIAASPGSGASKSVSAADNELLGTIQVRLSFSLSFSQNNTPPFSLLPSPLSPLPSC